MAPTVKSLPCPAVSATAGNLQPAEAVGLGGEVPLLPPTTRVRGREGGMDSSGECLRVLSPAQGVLPSFVVTPDPPRGRGSGTPTFPLPVPLSPQGDVGLDRGLLILDHPARKLAPVGLGLCLPRVLQRVGPVCVSGDLGGPHGVDRVPVLHPGEVQVGGIEVARVASEIDSLMMGRVRLGGLGGDLHGGNDWQRNRKKVC